MDFSESGYEFKEGEIVDIMNNKPKDVTHALLNFYIKTQFDCCKYCKLPDPKDTVPPAIQVGEE